MANGLKAFGSPRFRTLTRSGSRDIGDRAAIGWKGSGARRCATAIFGCPESMTTEGYLAGDIGKEAGRMKFGPGAIGITTGIGFRDG